MHAPAPHPPRDEELAGLFISFEGGDGAGKTTQINALITTLTGPHGVIAPDMLVLTREPGGTDLGVALRHELQDAGDVSPRAEALLYAGDRAQHMETVIRPALREGRVVVTDRYLDSSIAYQGSRGDVDPEDVRDLSLWAVGGLVPDLTVLLDLDPAEAAARRARLAAEHGVQPDRLEREDEAYHTAVRERYLHLAQDEPTRFVVVDAAAPAESIAIDLGRRVADAIRARGLAPERRA